MQQLNALQQFVETDFCQLTDTFSYSRNYFSYLEKATDEEEKERIQWEIAVMHYTFGKGQFNPVFRQPDVSGLKVQEYPNLEESNKEICEYLVGRASATANDFLIVRYRLLLWNAPVRGYKNEIHAKTAIAALIRIVNGLINSTEVDDAYPALICAFELTSQIKGGQFSKLQEMAKTLLWQTPNFSNYLKINLLDSMLDCSQVKTDFYTNAPSLCEEIANKWMEENHVRLILMATNVGLRVASKLGQDARFWHNKLGEAHEKFAEYRNDDQTGMIPLSELNKALKSYRLAGNDVKIEEIGKKFEHQKLTLSKGRIRIDISKIQQFLQFYEEEANRLSNLSSEAIFEYLGTNENILPKTAALNNIAVDKQSLFLDFAQKIEFDRNKNIRENPAKDDEKKAKEVLIVYRQQVELFTLPYLQAIFEKSILQQKINFDSLMNFWADHSWFGQTITGVDSAGKEQPYNWLGLIAPAILEFFTQKEATLTVPGVFTNYILCIDSLTIKFEGVLRDFAQIAGMNVRKMSRKEMQLVHIEDILTDPSTKEYFDEDDIMFFKFLFTRNGVNLRNNVAHGFFRFKDYQEAWMLMLIFAFIRLGRYKLEERKEEEKPTK